MAVADGNGGLIIPTKVDTSGIKKGKSAIVAEIKATEKEVDRLQKKLDDLQNKEDYGASESVKKIGDNLEKAAEKAKKLEEEYKKLSDAKKEIEDSAVKAGKDQIPIYSPGAEAELALINEQIAKLAPELESAKERASELSVELDKAVSEDKNKQIEETKNKIAELTGKIASLKEKTKSATSSSATAFDKFFKKISTMAKRVFFFSAILAGFRSLKSAIGDVLKSDDEFQLSLNQLRASLYTAFTPIMQIIIPILKTLVKWLSIATQWIAGFIAGITGKSYKQSVQQAKALKAQADGYDQVAKSAKKASKQLAGFDELNTLNNDEGGAADDVSSIGFAGAAAAEAFDEIFDSEAGEKGEEIGKKIYDFFEPLRNLFKDLKERFGDFGAVVIVVVGALLGFLLIKWLLNWLFGVKKGVKGVSEGFGGFLDKLGTAAAAIAVLGGLAFVIDSITKLIEVFAESGLSLGDVAGLLGISLGILVGAFALLLGTLKLLKPSWQDIAAAAVILIGLALILETLSHVLEAFGESGAKASDVSLVLGVVFVSLIALVIALAAAAQMLQDPLVLGGLVLIVVALVAILYTLAETLPTILDVAGDFIEQVAPYVIEAIDRILDGIKEIIHELGVSLPPIVESIADLFETVFSNIGDIIDKIGDNIYKILVDGIAGAIEHVLDSVINFVYEAGPAVNNFVDNLIQAVTKLINFIISGMEFMINATIIDAINNLLRGINKIPGIDIPLLQDKKLRRFVPQLAQGTVVPPNKEFMAILGDNKTETEVVSPLSTMKQAFIEALQSAGGIGGGQDNRPIILQIDGREIARATREGNASLGTQTTFGGFANAY